MFKTEHFAKIVNSWKPSIIFVKRFILDVVQGSKYVSVYVENFRIIKVMWFPTYINATATHRRSNKFANDESFVKRVGVHNIIINISRIKVTWKYLSRQCLFTPTNHRKKFLTFCTSYNLQIFRLNLCQFSPCFYLSVRLNRFFSCSFI